LSYASGSVGIDC